MHIGLCIGVHICEHICVHIGLHVQRLSRHVRGVFRGVLHRAVVQQVGVERGVGELVALTQVRQPGGRGVVGFGFGGGGGFGAGREPWLVDALDGRAAQRRFGLDGGCG